MSIRRTNGNPYSGRLTATCATLSTVEFPFIPGTVERIRSADLEIPLSFRLHAFDEMYCPQGALTLLKVAARLHAFVLPIDADGDATVHAQIETVKSGTTDAQEINAETVAAVQFGRSPVTCSLAIIFPDDDTPSIACIGYVRKVGVKLHPGKSFNLPSAGDFSFTFVRRPVATVLKN